MSHELTHDTTADELERGRAWGVVRCAPLLSFLFIYSYVTRKQDDALTPAQPTTQGITCFSLDALRYRLRLIHPRVASPVEVPRRMYIVDNREFVKITGIE